MNMTTLLLVILAVSLTCHGMVIPKGTTPPCHHGGCLLQTAGQDSAGDNNQQVTTADHINFLLLTRLENLLFESAHIVAVLDTEATLEDNGLGSFLEEGVKPDPELRADSNELGPHLRENSNRWAPTDKFGSHLPETDNFDISPGKDNAISEALEGAGIESRIREENSDMGLRGAPSTGFGLALKVDKDDLDPVTTDDLDLMATDDLDPIASDDLDLVATDDLNPTARDNDNLDLDATLVDNNANLIPELMSDNKPSQKTVHLSVSSSTRVHPTNGRTNIEQRLQLILRALKRKENDNSVKDTVVHSLSYGGSKGEAVEKRASRLSVTVALGTLSDLLSQVRSQKSAQIRQRSRARLHTMGR